MASRLRAPYGKRAQCPPREDDHSQRRAEGEQERQRAAARAFMLCRGLAVGGGHESDYFTLEEETPDDFRQLLLELEAHRCPVERALAFEFAPQCAAQLKINGDAVRRRLPAQYGFSLLDSHRHAALSDDFPLGPKTTKTKD